ncbi:hypothetical protein CsSME_00007347 [Camellia sinensis var. sinensis]
MGIGNNNIGSPTTREEYRAMMDLRNHNIGSAAVDSRTSQSIDDQVLTPGYVRSLGGSSLNKLGVKIEVVLGQNEGLCQGYGLKQLGQLRTDQVYLKPRSWSPVFDLHKIRRGRRRGASTSKTVPKAAMWRAVVVAAISLSASVENVTDKGRHILTEAQATLKMGEVLGVKYNGKEDEVIHKIVELELKDKERIGRGDRGGV